MNNLVGLLLLEKISKIVDNEDNGQFQDDDRLIIVKGNNRGIIEQIRKISSMSSVSPMKLT